LAGRRRATGNWRSNGEGLVLIDWSDNSVGHPMIDRAAFFARIPRETIARAGRAWSEARRTKALGSGPERALQLIAPIVHLLGAWTYRRFSRRNRKLNAQGQPVMAFIPTVHTIDAPVDAQHP
jgi:hypothetical protein